MSSIPNTSGTEQSMFGISMLSPTFIFWEKKLTCSFFNRFPSLRPTFFWISFNSGINLHFTIPVGDITSLYASSIFRTNFSIWHASNKICVLEPVHSSSKYVLKPGLPGSTWQPSSLHMPLLDACPSITRACTMKPSWCTSINT